MTTFEKAYETIERLAVDHARDAGYNVDGLCQCTTCGMIRNYVALLSAQPGFQVRRDVDVVANMLLMVEAWIAAGLFGLIYIAAAEDGYVDSEFYLESLPTVMRLAGDRVSAYFEAAGAAENQKQIHELRRLFEQ